MASAQLIHDEIVQKLRQENVIDLATLPSAREREDMRTQVKNILEKNYVAIDPTVRDRVQGEFFSAGPLEHLMSDKDVTEIIVNGPKTIWYEKWGRLHQHEDYFLSAVSYQNFIHRLTSEARIQANLDRPFADGYWRQYRVHLIIPPLAQGGAHLSLRRHPDNPWTLSRLEEMKWASPDALQYLRKMVADHSSFLVIGSTGSGKTSVLSACLQSLAPQERAVVIEDTNEIHLPNKLSAKLISRQDPQGVLKDVDQGELLRQALRMRPDRIVLGEVRGAEAKDLLMALSTGHRGGMGTLHADSARQALYRLEMLVQLGAPQWSLRAIRHLIFFGIQFVVTVTKTNGERQLDSIHRITSLEETGFCLEKVVFKL